MSWPNWSKWRGSSLVVWLCERAKKPVLILEFWGSYAKLCGRQVRVGVWWWGGWDERMDVTNAFVRVSLRLESRSRNCLRNSISSAARYTFNSFVLSRARDCTTFTLHDLIDFYIERATAHHIKIMIIHVFKNRRPNSKNETKIKTLRARFFFYIFYLWKKAQLLTFAVM